MRTMPCGSGIGMRTSAWFSKGLCALNRDHTVEEWLALLMEFGRVNYRCMELLDEANTG